MKTLATFILAASLAIGSISLAAAQYPPPGAAVVITTSDPNPGVGETVSLTVQVSAPAASNIEGTSGRAILASMPSAPQDDIRTASLQAPPYSCTTSVSGGSGASVSPSTLQTDANGVAAVSLYTGTQAANLTVTVSCGTVSGQAIVPVGNVGGGGGSGPTTTVPQPPSTGLGTGGDSGMGDGATWMIVVGAAAVAIAGTAGVALRKTRGGTTRS